MIVDYHLHQHAYCRRTWDGTFELALEPARAAGYATVAVFDPQRARQEPLG